MILTIPNLVPIGSVIRLHGYKGDLKIALNKGIILKKLKEQVFVNIAQKPVPFFIESSQQAPEQIILKLKDIETEDQANELLNRTILVDKSLVKTSSIEFQENEWEGYTVFDELNQKVGIAKELVNYNQWLLNVDIDGVEAMLPINEETLLEVKKTAKKLFLKIPDGLLDIYKEGK